MLHKTVWHLLKKLKNRIIIWPRNSTSGYLSNRTGNSLQEIFVHVFPAALFIIAKSNPNVYQQMNRQNMITRTMITRYDSALKRKGTPSHATTWMNPDDTTLSKTCHKKIKRLWFHLYEVIQSSQIHGNGAQNGAHQRLREGKRRFQILYTV